MIIQATKDLLKAKGWPFRWKPLVRRVRDWTSVSLLNLSLDWLDGRSMMLNKNVSSIGLHQDRSGFLVWSQPILGRITSLLIGLGYNNELQFKFEGLCVIRAFYVVKAELYTNMQAMLFQNMFMPGNYCLLLSTSRAAPPAGKFQGDVAKRSLKYCHLLRLNAYGK